MDTREGLWQGLLALYGEYHRSRKLEASLQDLLEVVRGHSFFERGLIGAYRFGQEEGCELSVLALEGTAWNAATGAFFEEQALRGESLMTSPSLVGEVLRTGELVVADAPRLREGDPVGVMLGVPLLDDGRLIGVLALAGSQRLRDIGQVAWLDACAQTCLDLMMFDALPHEVEHERLIEALTFTQAILDTVPDAIVSLSVEGMIRAVNPAAERMFGATARELIDTHVATILPGRASVAHRDMETGQIRILGVDGATEGRRSDGSTLPVEVRLCKGRFEQGRLITWLIRDITVEREVDRLKQHLGERYRFDNVIGDSPAMRRVFELARRIVDASAPVLITGESGVGKEVFAKLLHFQSARREQPFVAVNCAAIPRELIESELFGHERGAFTGALQRRIGKFEEAGAGTILLDEIGELDARVQAKLLRVLQERTFERVGSNTPRPVEARVLAATNRDLEAEIAAGRFREDLYYRLNVLSLRLPPLRERREDIPLLVHHSLKRLREREGREVRGLTPAAMAAMSAYDWPGNVRELENVIFRAGLVTPGAWIDLDGLPAHIRGDADGAPRPTAASAGAEATPAALSIRGKSLEELEELAIRLTMEELEGDVTAALKVLGTSRATLYRKLKKYGIETA